MRLVDEKQHRSVFKMLNGNDNDRYNLCLKIKEKIEKKERVKQTFGSNQKAFLIK
jgi:hypothetical protein